MKVITTTSSIIAIFGFVLLGFADTASAVILEARLQLAYDETPCLAGQLTNLDVGEDCTGERVRMAIRKLFGTLPSGSCGWDVNYELMLITRTLSNNKVVALLQTLCDSAVATVFPNAPRTAWTDIDAKFTPEFMDVYTEGGTFLNDKTGNFRNRDGTDPRKNRFFPTDTESYEAGVKIDAFYRDGAKSSVLDNIDHLSNCENQAIMCCFGRDRQYQDGNGSCAPRDCNDANPGDNSNLCYLEKDDDAGIVTPYPGDEIIHCHGLAWSKDDSEASNILRFNNFFYVLMHDHMYSRGYVSPAVPGASMCGCIEDMSPVSRADCSEANMDVNYYVSYDALTGALTIVPEDLEFRFQACVGITPDPNDATKMIEEENDLASYVYKLTAEGHMSTKTRDNIFDVLVGHDSPNDNTNEAACAAAWAGASGGTPYSNRRKMSGN